MAEADYQICMRIDSTETCEDSRNQVPGGEIEAVGVSDNDSEDK